MEGKLQSLLPPRPYYDYDLYTEGDGWCCMSKRIISNHVLADQRLPLKYVFIYGSNRSEEQSRYDKKVNGEGLLREGLLRRKYPSITIIFSCILQSKRYALFLATAMASHIVGYPHIGPKRELKSALESFWDGKSNVDDL
ncbi:hypothetical protein JHK82_047906 [Glycine max]|nr:hypothetical protein JHK82_047906 [Glycine max]